MAVTTSLPVLMYHYISRYPDAIAVSPELFAAHCERLVHTGWRGITLAEAEAYFLHGESLPPKSCLITFDDGYLDNYVHAWPILCKYGHSGVIFAVAEKMETEDVLRPTLTDVWNGTLTEAELPRVNEPFVRHADGYEVRRDLFFSWREARAMEASGVMSIASHTLGHRGVFISDEFRGFFLPGRQSRTFHTPAPFFWGLPRFLMGPGLLERAFIINPKLAEKIRAMVPQDEREAFRFAGNENNMKALAELAVSFTGHIGCMEDDAAMAERMRAEIRMGKTILEKELGHAVTTLCWPWGAYCGLSLEIAKAEGFGVFVTTRAGANPPGKPLAVCRFKAKANDEAWLRSRTALYASPLLARLYALAQLRIPRGKNGRSFVVRMR